MIKKTLKIFEGFCDNTIAGYIEFKKMKKWKQVLQMTCMICFPLSVFILLETKEEKDKYQTLLEKYEENESTFLQSRATQEENGV